MQPTVIVAPTLTSQVRDLVYLQGQQQTVLLATTGQILPVGTVSDGGVSPIAARADHVHAVTAIDGGTP
jgi:hypothetical protein